MKWFCSTKLGFDLFLFISIFLYLIRDSSNQKETTGYSKFVFDLVVTLLKCKIMFKAFLNYVQTMNQNYVQVTCDWNSKRVGEIC